MATDATIPAADPDPTPAAPTTPDQVATVPAADPATSSAPAPVTSTADPTTTPPAEPAPSASSTPPAAPATETPPALPPAAPPETGPAPSVEAEALAAVASHDPGTATELDGLITKLKAEIETAYAHPPHRGAIPHPVPSRMLLGWAKETLVKIMRRRRYEDLRAMLPDPPDLSARPTVGGEVLAIVQAWGPSEGLPALQAAADRVHGRLAAELAKIEARLTAEFAPLAPGVKTTPHDKRRVGEGFAGHDLPSWCALVDARLERARPDIERKREIEAILGALSSSPVDALVAEWLRVDIPAITYKPMAESAEYEKHGVGFDKIRDTVL